MKRLKCCQAIGFIMCSCRHNKKTTGFIVFSHTRVEKSLALLCVRARMLKKHWLYCVFAPPCCKIICFIMFSLRKTHKSCLTVQKRPSRYRCLPKFASPEKLKQFDIEKRAEMHAHTHTHTHARTHQNHVFFYIKNIKTQTT